ncbi:CpsD/CapB family tyrosine-protein kinase [Jannaschia sp. 2305UL9-9]|uniref:CpsD/CapB family tyrosine-protein kinase n=1 Tax=Jannaschia sp. 2305UL9-9 TaxID=3121638 RepID=UPI0035287968
MERIQTAIAKARAARDGAPRNVTRKPVLRPSDVEAAWAAVPMADLNNRKLKARRVTAFESGSETAEFDRLRTRMLQRMQSKNWTRVAVVSPTAQNGKSTVVSNLAFSFARQKHLNTMVIELDLRRPGLSPILDLPRGLDVSRVLEGQADFADHAVRLRDNLIIAPTLPVQGNAAELLQSPDTAIALNGIAEDYRPSVMIFDMPPIGVSDDVIGFLSNVDCVLIVAAAGMTSLTEISDCERDVAERTEVLGVVLNKCRYEPKGTGYGDYY